MEEMNNMCVWGGSLSISLTPRASLTSSPKPITKSDKVHGRYSQLGKGENRTKGSEEHRQWVQFM